MTAKTVSLVLGSGGARGLCHIGIIHYLQEQGYEIRSVAGCSMGALVGGIFAAGKLDEFEHWVRAVSKGSMVSLLDLAWDSSGLVKGDKIIATLKELVGEKSIESLPIPFTAVAADVAGEKEIWLQNGCLFDAIRASISLPLFFTPFDFNGTPLIDGGVLNPVPIAPTFGDNNDLTIAVNLGGPARQQLPPTEKTVAEPDGESPFYQEMIGKFLSQFDMATNSVISKNIGAYDIASQAFDAMQGTIARQKLAAYPPDIVIDVPRNVCGMLEFDRAAEMIQFGYQQAQTRMSELSATISE